MNEIICLFICMACMLPALIISYFKTGKKLNIITFITVWYVFWCIVSCTKFCGYVVEFDYGRLYVMSNILVLITVFSITMFNNQAFIGENIKKELIKNNKMQSSQLVNIARVVVFFVEIYFLGIVVSQLIQGKVTIYTLRTAAYASGERALFSSMADTIYFVFVKGFVIFDIIFEIVQIVNWRKRPVYFPIINLFIFCLTTLNRIELVRTILLVFICIVLTGTSISEILNRNKRLKKIVVFFSMAVALLIILRYAIKDSKEGMIQSVMSTIFSNFSIPFVTFNRFFLQYLEGVRIVECSIFDILFSGPIKMLQPFFNLFDIEVFNFNGYLAERINYAIDIGHNKVFKVNAFYTMYYNLVNGGGLVIPYFVSGAFGGILGILYNRWRSRSNNRNLALLIFSIHVTIYGLLRWEMYAHWSWVTLFLILLFTGKRKFKFCFEQNNSFMKE